MSPRPSTVAACPSRITASSGPASAASPPCSTVMPSGVHHEHPHACLRLQIDPARNALAHDAVRQPPAPRHHVEVGDRPVDQRRPRRHVGRKRQRIAGTSQPHRNSALHREDQARALGHHQRPVDARKGREGTAFGHPRHGDAPVEIVQPGVGGNTAISVVSPPPFFHGIRRCLSARSSFIVVFLGGQPFHNRPCFELARHGTT